MILLFSLYIIIIEFCIYVKLDGIFNTRLNKHNSKISMQVNYCLLYFVLSLKQVDSLSPLFFSFSFARPLGRPNKKEGAVVGLNGASKSDQY
jgi:hypothetical protein